jgi:PAS domain S-box-containing protein
MTRPQGPRSEGEERFRNLAEQAHDLISETDAEGRFLYVSPNHERVLGFPPDALVGTFALDLVHPEDLPEARRAFAEGMTRKQPGRVVVRLATADGDWRWFEVSGRPYATSVGEARVALIGRDTSERRAAEQALRDSEQRYRLLVETASSGIVESDRAGVITFANRACAEMIGVPADQLVGRGVWEFAAEPDDHERVRGEISAAVRHEPRPRRRIENLRGPAGRRVAAEVDWNFVRDAEGRVTGFVSFVNDVTRREEADRALADSHRFISHIAEATPHMLCVFEIATRRLLYCNSRVHQVLGWDPADLDAFGPGLFEKVVHPEDLARVSQSMIEAIGSDDERAVELEYRSRHGSGDWRWLRARLTGVARNPDGTPRDPLMAADGQRGHHGPAPGGGGAARLGGALPAGGRERLRLHPRARTRRGSTLSLALLPGYPGLRPGQAHHP